MGLRISQRAVAFRRIENAVGTKPVLSNSHHIKSTYDIAIKNR
jgi:hypothetical protein